MSRENKAQPPGRLMKVREVAERLGVSEELVYRLCRSGDLGSQQVGRAVRVSEGDLVAYLARTHRGRAG